MRRVSAGGESWSTARFIANCVALGSYIAKRKIFTKDNLFRAIEEFAPQDKRGLIEINKQAVSKGIEEVKK